MSSSPFVFEIGADISKFTKSISEVDAELKVLRNSLKTQTGAAIVETNKQIKQLENSLVDLKKVGLDKLPKGAVDGANALFSLNQVARDLPFGFVAIQNNLPGVFDSFAKLSKESGGVTNAFKSIGSALVGPAGLSFAIGAAISGITSLVQSYGSLGAAVTDIFGLQVKERDLQNSLNSAFAVSNGEIAGEVANMKSLSSILISTNSTLEQRNGAYAQLNKEYPGILFGISKEEIATGKVNEQIAKRIKLFSLQLELEGKADSIRELISKSAKEQLELGAKLKTGGFFDVLGLQLKGFFQTGDAGVTGVLSAVGNTFQKTSAEADFFNKSLTKVNQELVVVNAEVDKLVKGQKDADAALKNASKAINQQAKDWEKFQEQTRKSNERLAEFYTNQLQQQALKNRTEELKKQAKAQEDLTKATLDGAMIEMDQNPFDWVKEFRKTADPLKIEQDIAFNQGSKIDYLKSQFESLQAVFDKTKSSIESSLVEPFGLLFDNLTTKGKSAFEGFGKMAIGIIKKIATQLIVSGIANLLTNILFPQVGAAKGIMATLGSFTKGGGFLGFGGVANPSFGGVNGGGMSLSGQVVFVQRGSDLVGALNRTNAQINRVG
jgi:hypothetical protein